MAPRLTQRRTLQLLAIRHLDPKPLFQHYLVRSQPCLPELTEQADNVIKMIKKKCYSLLVIHHYLSVLISSQSVKRLDQIEEATWYAEQK